MSVNPGVQRWNDKYLNASPVVEPRAEPELVACEKYLSGNGLALEVASGKGANALYLAGLGYEVIALDCAINGLKLAARSAQQHGLELHQAVVDLNTFKFPENTFDLISVIRYLQRSAFDQLIAALKPGGLLFYKTFNRQHLESHPNFNPDYVLDKGELLNSFRGLEILNDDSSGSGESASSFILGRKY